MTLTPLIIFLISALGYASFRLTPIGKLKLRRYSPAKLALKLGIEGTFILVSGVILYALLASVLIQLNYAFLQSTNLLADIIPYYQVSNATLVLFASTLLLLCLRILIGRFTCKEQRDNPAKLIRKLVDDELELFLLDALELENVEPLKLNGNKTAARVVLDSRKVYIGNIVRCDLTMGVNSNIVIVPMHSGFQDEKTLELKLTEHYEGHFKTLLKSNSQQDTTLLFRQFEIVIPIHRIVSASLFNIDTYIAFLEMKIAKLERQKHSTEVSAIQTTISFDENAPAP